MVGVQFFSKTTQNLQERKASIIGALDVLETLAIWTNEQVSFFRTYIASQVSYIPRDDMAFFGTNVQKLCENQEILTLYKQRIAQLTGVDVQTCFELVSRLHDVVLERKQEQQKLLTEVRKKEHLVHAHEQEQQEKIKSLAALEQQLENL